MLQLFVALGIGSMEEVRTVLTRSLVIDGASSYSLLVLLSELVQVVGGR